jgi:hypothetical protein
MLVQIVDDAVLDDGLRDRLVGDSGKPPTDSPPAARSRVVEEIKVAMSGGIWVAAKSASKIDRLWSALIRSGQSMPA